nr:microcompartment protein PduM [uncultured Enterobacter sp.]
MTGEQMQHIVGLIVARLQARTGQTATLSVDALRAASVMALCCACGRLQIQQADLCFLQRLAQGESTDPAIEHLTQALALGVAVDVSVRRDLLVCLPVKKLARLPVAFADEHGQPVRFHPAAVLSYRDVAGLPAGWLVTARHTVITALAREAAHTHHIQLVKQE